MKKLSVLLVLMLFVPSAFGQVSAKKKSPVTFPALRELVATEIRFAKMAEEKGSKTAFLHFLADDGLIFEPTERNGKLAWKNRAASAALLSWHPAIADISSDGTLGYTTGGWEYRPKGKTDKPVAFGEYVTIWVKQPDGTFKAALDIGIRHPTTTYSKAGAVFPPDAGIGEKSVRNAVDLGTLTDIFSNKSLASGYFNYLANDSVVLREGYLPFVGREKAFIGLEKLDGDFPAMSFLNFTGNLSKVHGNMMYAWGVFQLSHKDKSVSRWNFLQIWKNRGGQWQIVLDLFSPIPEAEK